MKLNELKYTEGSRRRELRVGRGMGSKGKTCGRGMNGQSKHNGAGTRPGFEGGQLPLYRAIPKFGFTNFIKLGKIFSLYIFTYFDIAFNSFLDV